MIQVGDHEWIVLRTLHDTSGRRMLTARLTSILNVAWSEEYIATRLWRLLVLGLIGHDAETETVFLMDKGCLAVRNIGVEDYPVMVPVNARFLVNE